MAFMIVASLCMASLWCVHCAPDHGLVPQTEAIASSRAKAPEFRQWIGRTLVPEGQVPPKSGRFVLESDIPSPHVILKPGMATDTVFISNRITIMVDDRMMILHVWRG